MCVFYLYLFVSNAIVKYLPNEPPYKQYKITNNIAIILKTQIDDPQLKIYTP